MDRTHPADHAGCPDGDLPEDRLKKQPVVVDRAAWGRCLCQAEDPSVVSIDLPEEQAAARPSVKQEEAQAKNLGQT